MCGSHLNRFFYQFPVPLDVKIHGGCSHVRKRHPAMQVSVIGKLADFPAGQARLFDDVSLLEALPFFDLARGRGGFRHGKFHLFGDHFHAVGHRGGADDPPGPGFVGDDVAFKLRAVGMHALNVEWPRSQRHAPHEVREGFDVAVVDSGDAVAGVQTRFPSRVSGLCAADHGGGSFDANVKRDGKKQHPGDDVHNHAGGDNRHPLRDAFGGIGPGVLGDFLVGHLGGVHVVLAQHFDVAAEGNQREGVFRLPAFEAPQDRPKADAEPLHVHIAPLGDGEVAEFVKEDHKPQPNGDVKNVKTLIQNRRREQRREPIRRGEKTRHQGCHRVVSFRAQPSSLSKSVKVGDGSNSWASKTALQARGISIKGSS